MSIYTDPTVVPSPEQAAWITSNGYLFQVVCTTVVVWDHITTFDLEVELIWKKKWSSVQLLYFINRYVGDFSFLYATGSMLWAPDEIWIDTDHFSLPNDFGLMQRFRCTSLGKVQTWFAIITLMSMQGIMVHRIVSMHKHERTVLYSLLAAFVVELVAALALGVGFALVTASVPAPITQTLRACIPINWPTWSPALWFLLMVFDTMIFIMAVREAIRYHRATRKRRIRSSDASDILAGTGLSSQPSLFQILVRDSILFPFIGLLMCVFNSLSWYKLPLGALQYTMNISAAGSPILGCRLILNLRDAYYRPFAEEVHITTRSIEISPGLTPQREHFEMPQTVMRPDQSMISLGSYDDRRP
ncbi:hypothetical protein FA13DRAFT_494170 [Coprinellus micaceus]|uniref:DUF6533 domain-containing protein n=1 Tax=Coprinellus micaceus TaxID=71717 RepID=A0A4Y7T9S6_COPMI|nr:hypothetical protein FA13DRAFT_494170 [Coprinellus micaceus]